MSDEKPKFSVVPMTTPHVSQEGVDRAKEMVGQLERGEIIGVAMAYTKPDGTMGNWWTNHVKGDFVLYAAIHNLVHRYDRKIEDGEDP